MKLSFEFLLLGIFVFLTATVFCQNTDIAITRSDTAIIIPPKPAILPDANLYGVPFRTFKGGKWTYNPQADTCYAQIWAVTGEAGSNPAKSDALASVDSSLTNPLEKGLIGYLSAVCKGGTVSFSEKLQNFDGRFWCRLNANWVLYTREGCANPACVYDPAEPLEKELVPKGGEPEDLYFSVPPTSPLVCCDTTILNVVVNCPPAGVMCCPIPKLSWSYLYPMIGVRSTYSSDLWIEPFFIGFGYRKHWRDSTKMSSTYAGTEVSFFIRNKTETVCDTCLEFTQDEFVKPAARWEIFCGKEFGIRELSKLRGFAEVRYCLLQPNVRPGDSIPDRQFLPKRSGLILRGGVRLDIGKKLQLHGLYEYDPVVRLSGGQLGAVFFLNNTKA